ncbi:hypothetical protein [Ornithinibacillus halotolerans]|uniref:Uncharacterized protein n=1 Tax=Ornithinibacillus halotolerans TaxID=1274357 RepID=A0A916S3J8_9BACI|nr:hypothetical protein [Ornithinibacillus halotolerans]GGA79698.1 hypothetical protein GCM10008025_23890 [Ornithinibacillus halotolerans]
METIREEKPNYVLKAKEAMLVPKNPNPWLGRIKKGVWIIVAFVILSSLIFQENMFKELSWSSQVMLVVLAVGLTFADGSHRVPSPFEIWFYDDYLILYREKYYYSRKVQRKEYWKFYYNEIEKIEFGTVKMRIAIYGDVEAIWYDYNKDGTVPEKPTYHRNVNRTICYFYTSADPDVDFVAEIEKHSPIKVVVAEK